MTGPRTIFRSLLFTHASLSLVATVQKPTKLGLGTSQPFKKTKISRAAAACFARSVTRQDVACAACHGRPCSGPQEIGWDV